VRFLADENIPLDTLHQLRRVGFDISSVSELSPGVSDEEVLKIAFHDGRVLITFDKDFSEFAFRRGQKLPGIVLLRFAPRSPENVTKILLAVLEQKDLIFEEHITIVEEARLRQRKLEA